MSWAKRYALRNVPFTAGRSASTYGAGTYGGDFSYGQEASDPLSNVEYVLAAEPGEWPSSTGWVYRVGDIGVEFVAVLLGIDGPLDLAGVDNASLVIERTGPGPGAFGGFTLDIDAVNNVVRRVFEEGDLEHPGMFRAAVHLVFTTGRCMTVTVDDSTPFIIRGI